MSAKGILAVLIVAISFVTVGCSDGSNYQRKAPKVVEIFEEDDDDFEIDIDIVKKPKKTYNQKSYTKPKTYKKKTYKRKKRTSSFFSSSRKRRYR